jgi:hypothetical protein
MAQSSTYEYGDHGALMVLADNYNPTTTLRYPWEGGGGRGGRRGARGGREMLILFSYSWNEGLSMVSCSFTNTAITVADIIASPNSTSQAFFVYPSFLSLSFYLPSLPFDS